ncbi:MAG: hypothetical protein MUF77_02395 [Leptospira sp.]|jgi:hypothetical protein|nr:hypothetical protein [Leptospira sp.]
MELFSLVLINVLFCGMMYVFISAKVQKSVNDYYDKRLNRAIDLATSETIRELDATVNIIESRLVALRQMMEKAEKLFSEFKHYEKMGLSMKEEIFPSNAFSNSERQNQEVQNQILDFKTDSNLQKDMNPDRESKRETNSDSNAELKEQRTGIGRIYQQNQFVTSIDEVETTEGAVNIAFGKLGKAVKGIFGMDTNQMPSAEAIDSLEVPILRPKTDYTVGGNPFQEEKESEVRYIDTNKRREFMNEVSKKNDPSFAAYQKNAMQKVELSIESALEELPPTASKIDKVVHLIKKGYSRDDISEAMNIGTHEIHLIETIRLDRSRRI